MIIQRLLVFMSLLAPPTLWEIEEEKYLVISPMLAPLGVTEMGYDNNGKPIVSKDAWLGLANALLFEATVGSIVYTIWRPSPTAGVVSLGLTYASYRVIKKAL